MKLDDRLAGLIAVGASVSANCQSCLKVNAARALENGANAQEIAEAVEVGKLVRRGAASKLDEFVSSLGETALSTARPWKDRCGCI
jgi:AhpD family alkylhydroperoxidase